MSGENYLRFDYDCPAPFQEFAIAELVEFGFDGFEQHDQGFIAFIPERLINEQLREAICEALNNSEYACVQQSETKIEPQNWNETWEKSITPQRVGCFWVYPSWLKEHPPSDSIPLIIDPKMAFGTGTHETTRLILCELPQVVEKNSSVLDVGTGTGILAIASLKLGARYALGFDIDEWSELNARENAALNQVTDCFDVRLGAFETVANQQRFELVLANVNRNILLEMDHQLYQHLAPGGTLLVSGLLYNEAHYLMENQYYGLLIHSVTLQQNDWIAMKFIKPET